MDRRDFIALSTLAVTSRSVLGANEKVRIGLIGAGLRGRSDAGAVVKNANAELVAVSDVYVPRREKAAANFGGPAKPVKDYREILDRKDIDGVIIATPNHWHVPMALEAVSAGKDIYLEKPVIHTLDETDKLLNGVASSNRVIATGTQQRSWTHYLKARDLVAGGRLGHVGLAESYWYQNYANLPPLVQRALDEPKVDPSQLDWNQWLGSTPKQPFDEVKYLYWRFFPDFGEGIFGDLMTHWIDVIQWYLDTPQPNLTQATGATHKFSQFQLPDTVSAGFEFPNNYTSNFVGSITCGLEDGGIVFRGEKATMKLTRRGFAIYDEPTQFGGGPLPPPAEEAKSTRDGTGENVDNWLDCIRSRKTPNANIRAGVQAARTSHLANLAMLQRKTILSDLA